jgi:hypothetical protein
MNDAELAILIRIQTEIASGKNPQEILQGIKEEAKKVGEVSHEAGHKGGEGFEFMGLKGHEAHAALRLLGGQLGEFGHLLHFIFSPELAGLVGFIIAMKMLNEQFAAMGELLEKNYEWQRKLKEIATQASDEAERGSKSETAAYELKLQHQFDGEDKLKKAIQERLKLYDSEQDHIKSLIDLDAGRFDAYIAYLVKTGKLTEEQGEQAKTAEKRRTEDSKERTEVNKAQADIKAKESTAEEETNKKLGLAAELPTAKAAAEAADKKAKKNQKEIEEEKKKYDELDKAATEAENKARTYALAGKTVLSPNSDWREKAGASAFLLQEAAQGNTPENMRQNASGLRAAADQQQGHVSKMLDNQEKLESASKAAAKNVESIESQTLELNKALKDLTDAIANAKAELAQKQSDYKGTRSEEDRGDAAAAYYRNPRPDAESRRLFGLGRSGTSYNDVQQGLKDVLTEAQNVQTSHRLGEDNEATVAATLQHIQAILASHVNLTEGMQKQLIQQETDLNALDQKLQRQAAGVPNYQ